MPLPGFDPLIDEWFRGRFAKVTEPQLLGWPEIRAGRDVLISAPTGSGKTLAAFLICLDELVKSARGGSLPNRTEIVYVSPLKALSNDIQKNLEAPLAEISALADAKGLRLAPIRTAVRTGDTTVRERLRMLEQPPHILVTTPESLFILLTADKSRKILQHAKAVIVDEIHAVAGDKRGSHLALTLARLEALVREASGGTLQRIGLSATVKPIEEVARLLSSSAGIVNVGHRREMHLAVESPKDELGAVATLSLWEDIYDRLAELIRTHRTTLVFVNTRRLSERVTHHLQERLGTEAVLAHHGSLSRRLRLDAEQRLKNGELRAVVATASLELGIDVGTIDLVCQIGSPRSLSVAFQRIGRSGHWVGAMPKGRLFVTTRDDLIECAAVVRAVRRGELDRLEIPEAPLDVLAQQIVAAAACGEWREDDLFELARGTWPYRSLARKDFDAVVEMLAEGIATVRGRSGAYLHHDRVNGRIRGRRGARLAAITSGGAIPDNANYLVVAEPEGATVGTVDEDFAVESSAGDVFLLGTVSWRIRRVEQGKVRVEDAHGAAPTVPFWRGEAPGRTAELSSEVSQLREEIAARPKEEAVEFLLHECSLDRRGAEQSVEYVHSGRAALGALPAQRTVVAERFFDEAGGMQLVIHAPFGSRINRAWGLALRKRFCRSFNIELQAAATDNGIVISLSEQHSFPLEIVFVFLKPENVAYVLTQAMLAAPLFTARWRWNASRALAILRFAGGRKVPPPIQRMRAEDLIAAVFPDQAACAENLDGDIRIPDHPLVTETVRDCLHEAMDVDGLRAVIAAMESGEIRTLARDTPEPSPFSHEILNTNPYAYLDDAPLEERRARAVQVRRTIRADVMDGVGDLDPAAIAEVAEDSWPSVRDADELHDALLTLVTVPPSAEWEPHFGALVAAHRATTLETGGRPFWVAAERIDLALAVHSDGGLAPWIETVLPSSPIPGTVEECVAAILRGWLESCGPVTAFGLSGRLAMPLDLVTSGLLRLEAEGQVLRGRFTPDLPNGELEWCNRRVLARIHRLTLGKLRREIQPASTSEFMRFLCRWQHILPGRQLHGLEGAFQIIRQLQGYEIPAAAWESFVLPRRIANYSPELLDRLCLSGEVMWGRISRHPAFDDPEPGPRRVRPTRVAPVAIFMREDAALFLGGLEKNHADTPLSHPARELLAELELRGASFFGELQRATGRLPSEVEDGLWELVAAGFVTADGFENLRALLDPKRRRGEGRGRHARPRHAAGRWALLRPHIPSPDAEEAHARQLLRRWGVVFRDLLAREASAPAWRDLLVILRRMEAKGEIRGGRFVDGVLGEQFALPEAVELLRAVRRAGKSGETVEISTADPLNLAGVILPGARISALAGGTINLRDGVPDAVCGASSGGGPVTAVVQST
ncbi:MAG TPA: DEAD/DEAH box helicase [Bryobacteraceae bacterium]|nr:DEAD/DEAH box helicase [Bryobacteraceae bacterium]